MVKSYKDSNPKKGIKMPRKKSLEELKREEEKLKEKLNLQRQKLLALRKKIREEYRKKEARFLIATGRTFWKYGKLITAKTSQTKLIALPLTEDVIEKLLPVFEKHIDVVKTNPDFAKWYEELRQVKKDTKETS